ncbi:MAG: DNA repair protein RadC [Crocinitomicaceae bacterium]
MNTTKFTIKSLAEDDRPREKMSLKGKQSLSDAELLAILINTGTKENSAIELAKKILNSYENDLNLLARASIKELTKCKGIGPAKAITIAAALELGRRKSAFTSQKVKITSSKSLYDSFKHLFEDKVHEEFYIILLNRSNTVIKPVLISKGGLSSTIVDGKIIFKDVLENNASAFIMCHNHPSGNVQPSQSDIDLTKKINSFAKLIDLQVLDHIIFTDKEYFSFVDEGVGF